MTPDKKIITHHLSPYIAYQGTQAEIDAALTDLRARHKSADRMARLYGEQAAREGTPYDANPYRTRLDMKLAWSEGHNAQRAAMLHDQPT